MAGSFADSSLRVWDLKGSSSNSPVSAPKNALHVLNGHSGPVYSTSFSPDNRWLLSCSEDQSARLWSLDTHSNIVCYRGHQAPIWDVQFSPLGFYFATASHDKTARLWATSQISPMRIFVGHMSDVNVLAICFLSSVTHSGC